MKLQKTDKVESPVRVDQQMLGRLRTPTIIQGIPDKSRWERVEGCQKWL